MGELVKRAEGQRATLWVQSWTCSAKGATSPRAPLVPDGASGTDASADQDHVDQEEEDSKPEYADEMELICDNDALEIDGVVCYKLLFFMFILGDFQIGIDFQKTFQLGSTAHFQ